MINPTNHISQKFDQNLTRLYHQLDELGSLTVSAMHDIKLFIDALANKNEPLAGTFKQAEQQTEEKLNKVLLIEIAINEECERILALYQPVASDLRTVISIIRVLGEIQSIANALQQMLKLVVRFNKSDAVEKDTVQKSVQIVGIDKLSYLAGQTALLLEIAMQLIIEADLRQSKPILKQYKLSKQGYKRLIKLLDKKTDSNEGKMPIHSFRFGQEFLRVITHVKLIIGHFIYLNEGKNVRHLSFKQMREIMELSLDHE